MTKYIVVDLETTGNLPKKGDRIIQFAAVVVENGTIIESFGSLVNPQRRIPIFIEELTGLTQEMVDEAPLFAEIAPRIMELLKDAYFVAHNVLFDLSFLQEELLEAGYQGFYGQIIDTVEMARVLNPTEDSYKLTDLAKVYGLNHDRPHQADSDAYVTAEILLILLEKLDTLPIKTLKQLHSLAGGLKSDLQSLLDEFLYRKQSSLEYLSECIEIFQGLAIKKQPTRLIEQRVETEQLYPKSPLEKKAIFQSSFRDVYEERLDQYVMMDEIMDAFENERHLLIEAGTGVGKSLGYLLPAAYFSNRNKVPVIVSTHTIQLQDQLLRKEFPLLKKMVSFPVEAVILKGRQHYISLEKFSYSLNEVFDNYDTTLTKMQILVWLTETETGDKDELNLSSGGLHFWNRIKTDKTFFDSATDWSSRDYYTRAREKAKSANLIITNHSLLLSNLEHENPMLPPYEFAVIDEGHHFEKTASRYLGNSLDYLQVRMVLGQFGTLEQRQLFYKVEQIMEHIQVNHDQYPSAFQVNQLIMQLVFEFDELFQIALMIAKKKYQGRSTPHKRVQILMEMKSKAKEWKALFHSGERMYFAVKDLIAAISSRLDFIQISKTKLNIDHKSTVEELAAFLEELKELHSSLKIVASSREDTVRWIEVDLRSPQNSTTFHAQPMAISEQLNSNFFGKNKSVILTSATLTVNNSFTFLLQGLGLDGNTRTLSIPSPFQYDQQVQLHISSDLPDVSSVPLDEYVAAITEHIISIAEATKGRMLILFTAHDMLKKTYEIIKESGFLEDYVIIAQGITSGSRTRLTKNFQKYDKAILLGTSSFWEGIDIPGEDLSCLVIVRLPFSPPDDPMTTAKSQQITEAGGNAFLQLALPEAIIRFKQGFGRLIRTKNDKGIVVVFDRRILTASYGQAFIDSIPKVPIHKGDIADLTFKIKKWLK